MVIIYKSKVLQFHQNICKMLFILQMFYVTTFYRLVKRIFLVYVVENIKILSPIIHGKKYLHKQRYHYFYK